ncbi:hypothetical protein BGX23_004187 [Mortierella sp. AD031]|nr:hypothetical protein BGX23_004187 [Mortierella sp. AD031]
MLAPQDPPTNATPPGSSTNTPLSSQSISRAPQVTNQFDDSSRASSIIAASPQYTDGYSVPPTHASDSPYRSPSNARHPHVQPSEYSPSVNHPQAYSPALSSNYVPPPSPTPSQPPVYPVSEGYNSYAKHDNAFQQQHRQHQPSHQTDPYQQTYQHQPYPKPITQVYPEPQFVDTPEKVNHQPVAQPKRRKKIIWIGAVVIVILIGVIIGLVVVMKNKTSDDNSNNNNSISGNSSTRTPTPTSAAFRPTATVTSTPINSTPVTFPTPIPVTVPSPGSSSGGGRVQAPGLPEPFPAPGRCDDFLCHNYFHKTCTGACSQDAEYKTCAAPCDALQSGNFCRADCERKNQCRA